MEMEDISIDELKQTVSFVGRVSCSKLEFVIGTIVPITNETEGVIVVVNKTTKQVINKYTISVPSMSIILEKICIIDAEICIIGSAYNSTSKQNNVIFGKFNQELEKKFLFMRNEKTGEIKNLP